MQKELLIGIVFLLVACTQVAVPSYNTSCISEQPFTVRGDSMQGIYTEGQEITALMNYTQCNNLTRYDHVLVNKAGNDASILKRVVGMPGDNWSLEENKIIINDEVLVNSLGQEYALTSQGVRMLSLYVDDYPTIEEGQLLIMGNQPSGTFDAARFGLISKEQVIGVVK